MTTEEARASLAKVLTEFLHVEATRAEVMKAADAYALAAWLQGHVDACRMLGGLYEENGHYRYYRYRPCGDDWYCEKANKKIQELGR